MDLASGGLIGGGLVVVLLVLAGVVLLAWAGARRRRAASGTGARGSTLPASVELGEMPPGYTPTGPRPLGAVPPAGVATPLPPVATDEVLPYRRTGSLLSPRERTFYD